MAHSRDKPLLGIISIISFVLALYLLLRPSSQGGTLTTYRLNLLATTVFSFNISILFACFSFGILGGVAFSVIAITLNLWLGLHTSIYGYYIFFLSFIIAPFIGYGCLKDAERIDRSYRLKIEKLEEESNLLYYNVQNKKDYIKSLGEKLKGYAKLKEVAENLSAVLASEKINMLILENALKMLKKGGRALLFLVDVENQDLVLSASKGAEDISKVKAKKGDVFDHMVLKYRKPLMIEDITKDFRFPVESVEEAKSYFRSLIAAPLISENRIIGVLRIDNIKEFMYTQDDLRILDIISDLGALALENSILYSRTQDLAVRDGLTGLFVRRYFMERFEEELERAARKKGTFSVLMVDIDHFKDYNDKYGHTSGDIVLKYLTRKISAFIKEGDIPARYGGDEIVIFLLGEEKQEASKRARAIQEQLEKDPLVLRREKVNMTVSIGISSYPKDAVLEEEIIKIADERLYKAKSKGRNKICAD